MLVNVIEIMTKPQNHYEDLRLNEVKISVKISCNTDSVNIASYEQVWEALR